jgi:hypothetical protein
MQYQRTGFYKGIPGFTVSSDDGLLEAAEASIYRQWWQLLRLSPVYWYARETGIEPVIPEIASNYEKVGALKTPSFRIWWQRHGKYLFEEAKRPAKVRLLNIDEPVNNELYQNSVVVEIPLTITGKKIIRDLKELLREIEHDVTGRNVINLSNASLKLKSKKFNLTTIEHEYWVLLYRILYPDISVWKIGDRLQLAPNNKVRNIDLKAMNANYSSISSPVAKLQSLTGRNLYKARFARYHVERGSFPNYTKVADLNSVEPFGKKRHSEFIEATNETNRDEQGNHTPDSPWQQYLKVNYQSDLHNRIIDVNKHRHKYIRENDFKEKYENFIAGSIDIY